MRRPAATLRFIAISLRANMGLRQMRHIALERRRDSICEGYPMRIELTRIASDLCGVFGLQG
jgi:hypothetical protein